MRDKLFVSHLKLNFMRLKKQFYRVVNDLGNWSQELCIMNDWSKDGFTEEEYRYWLNSVSRFLRVLVKHNPSDLIVK